MEHLTYFSIGFPTISNISGEIDLELFSAQDPKIIEERRPFKFLN